MISVHDNTSTSSNRPEINGQQLGNMLHALGLTPSNSGRASRWAYRNRYAANPQSNNSMTCDDFTSWDDLVTKGYAYRRIVSDTHYAWFEVTEKGIAAMDALRPNNRVGTRIPRFLKEEMRRRLK